MNFEPRHGMQTPPGAIRCTILLDARTRTSGWANICSSSPPEVWSGSARTDGQLRLGAARFLSTRCHRSPHLAAVPGRPDYSQYSGGTIFVPSVCVVSGRGL